MSQITKNGAEEIEEKLRKKAPKKSGRQKFEVTTREGREHTIVAISYEGVFVGQYGIKRGSRRDAGHGWVPDQIHLTPHKAHELATCSMSVDGYLDVLVEKNIITERTEESDELPTPP